MDDAYKVYASSPSSRHLSLSKLCAPCFRSPAIAMADVEMKPVDEEKKTGEEKKEESKEPSPPPLTPTAEIKANVALIERAVATLEPRFTHRVLRTLTALRKKLDNAILREAIAEVYPTGMFITCRCLHAFKAVA